jgi:NAD(P)-dependent dehydrogenase (short-subunit alcohol dehydrogenase family)
MSLQLFSLAGKTAIVTGSGRGLGRAIAKGMAAAGAALVTCARTGSEAESAAEEIRAAGGRAIGLAADVAEPTQCEMLVDRAVAAFGHLDIMHCNASIDRPQPADQVDRASLEAVLAVNVGGYLFSAQAAARQMRQQGSGGAIVMTSSTASLVAFPGIISYNISKGGVDLMVKTLAAEWAEHGIRVNAFNPGYMEHAMTGTEIYDQDPAVAEQAIQLTPMRRRGRVEELVGPAIFLASDASSFMTGVVMPVDGGWCAI